jgi:hypothetical protein
MKSTRLQISLAALLGLVLAGGAQTSVAKDKDVYVRDNASDTGATPSTGNHAESPDIMPEKIVEFTENEMKITVHNRGTKAVSKVAVDLYWFEATTGGPQFDLKRDYQEPSPGGQANPSFKWSLAGRGEVTDVPPSEGTKVATIKWKPTVAGHVCLIVVLRTDEDAFEDPNAVICDEVVRKNNNVCQRNVNIIHDDPNKPDEKKCDSFVIPNPDPCEGKRFDLVIDGRTIPAGAKVVLVLPCVEDSAFHLTNLTKTPILPSQLCPNDDPCAKCKCADKPSPCMPAYEIKPGTIARLTDIPVPAGTKVPAQIVIVETPTTPPGSEFKVVVEQFFDHCYLGNLTTVVQRK